MKKVINDRSTEFYINEYIVCWRRGLYVWEWYRKFFANKKDARCFAKKHKNKNIRPYPYIIRQKALNTSFKEGIYIEPTTEPKDLWDHEEKIIKY